MPVVFAVYQLITCLSTKRLPKEIEIGKVNDEEPDDLIDDASMRGQLLWIRGLSRLQHQVRYLFANCVTLSSQFSMIIAYRQRMHA